MFQKGKEKNEIEIPFDKLFKRSNISYLNAFKLKHKRAYSNMSDSIIMHNNMILKKNNFSILPDYMKLKFEIDKGELTVDKFIEKLYQMIITPDIVRCIKEISEENYNLNLDEESKNVTKRYEGLQFTDEHCKGLYCVSLGMKFIIPLVMHFAFSTKEKLNLPEFLMESYDELFNRMSDDTDLLSKLHESVYFRVAATRKSDQVFWNYFQILGYTVEQVSSMVFQKLIVDIVPKYEFTKNPISLNAVAIDNTIDYIIRVNYPISFKPMTLIADDDDSISDFDRMSINAARTNESDIMINKMKIQSAIVTLIKQHNLIITDKEKEYYMKNMISLNKLQKNLVSLFFAKNIGINTIDYCKYDEYLNLVLVMKKIMEQMGFTTINQIVIAQINSEITEKTTLNKKSLTKITESGRYRKLIESKYKDTYKNILENNTIVMIIATILNNKFINNDIDSPDFGNEIMINPDILSEEVIRLLEYI